MPKEKAVLAALQRFADAVKAKSSQLTLGEPEDQLRGPFENLLQEVGNALSLKIVSTGETRLPGRLGKPDYAVHTRKLLIGYTELKAPGIGANPNRFTGHNQEQWKRFKAIPNLLYSDGNDWGLYRNGEAIGQAVRLSGDVVTGGKKAVTLRNAQAFLGMITDFFSWQPILPTRPTGELDIKAFAAMLAPLCRMLRDTVTDALKDPQSSLVQLAQDWRKLLFPDASDEQFADAYAQTVTFALLLARSEGADPLDCASAETALAADHNLLSKALQVLTDPAVRAEISVPMGLLVRVIGEVAPRSLAGREDPWLYFYEDFLAIYDPQLRKDAGAYYTPVEVVHAQVRLVDHLLTNPPLNKPLGFADHDVVTLDPAAGTGTYLLGVIEHALKNVEGRQGIGAVPGQATTLASNLYGFEMMVGPFAVSELRVSRTLEGKGAVLPSDGTHIYLTDTLESPNAEPPSLPLILKAFADQHTRALHVKSNVPVIVCLGNPPYDRHKAVDPKDISSLGRYGGWVRFGDELKGETSNKEGRPARGPRWEAVTTTSVATLRKREIRSILYPAFVQRAKDAGHGGDVKNLYNLYVYFWRWALWKVFEHKTTAGPGIVSFISASSYLDGNAFCGMREHMRRLCDEIWLLDLGGEGRGTRKSDNIFAIQTPVVIAIAVRYDKGDQSTPAAVHFARIDGTREKKLRALDAIQDLTSLQWEDCPGDWHAPFRPAGRGAYFDWPLLADLLPWQHSGVQLKRTWPIAPDKGTLDKRWRALLSSEDRSSAFRGSGDREVEGTYRLALTKIADSTPISQLPRDAPMPPVVCYAYRSFGRQFLIADGRLISRPRPDMWAAHGDRQLYLTTLLNHPLGGGPALTAAAELPDLHHFRGSYGAKEAFPAYRDAEGKEANILPGLLEMLSSAYGQEVTFEGLIAYVYGVLAQPAFTDRYSKELETREVRVPITKDKALFAQACGIGARLLWLHTFGQRFVPKGYQRGQVPPGKAKCVKPVPGDAANYPKEYEYNDTAQTLRVGGGVFAPVSSQTYEFEVSGLKVVQSWLKYRMKGGAGKKSSPLDDIGPERWTSHFTTELLELLWVLEATLAEYPKQADLLSRIVEAPCFDASELPAVPEQARIAPKPPPGGLFNGSE